MATYTVSKITLPNGDICNIKDTTYSAATQSAAGLMSAADKKKLDGIATGAQVNSITGVKGDAESSYRTGNVNLTAANVGAYSKTETDSAIQQSTQDVTYALYDNSYNSCVCKVGRLCFITCVTGAWYNTNDSQTIRSGSATSTPWVIPSGFRPVRICEIREANTNRRITINTDGSVLCNEVLSSGAALRFSGCYICA